MRRCIFKATNSPFESRAQALKEYTYKNEVMFSIHCKCAPNDIKWFTNKHMVRRVLQSQASIVYIYF